MKKSTTKRSLLVSVLALVMCVTMLVGTTFAWFTDSASTSVSRIEAGKLNVALEMQDNDGNWVSAEGKTLQFKVEGKIPAEGTQILWEPGCTYELPTLRIVNEGNLALKYKVVISGIQGDAELNKVIDWTMDSDVLGTDVPLAVGQSKEFTIKGQMQKDASNHYQGMTIDGIAITVYAKQDTVESDSNNNEYDKDAVYATAGASVKVDDANKVVNEVVMVSHEEQENGGAIAKVTVPAGAAVNENTTNLELKITETDTPSHITIAATSDDKTLEVKMEGLSPDNTVPVKVEMFVGKGLKNFTMLHNGKAMTARDTINGVKEDQDYFYDKNTGVVTFLTSTFSPFTCVYDKANWSGSTAADYVTPVDEDNKIVTITSAEELALLAKKVNAGTSYKGYTVKLANDIDLGSRLWTPIGKNGYSSKKPFEGVFDGNGKTISNLLINNSYQSDVGLFGLTTNGEIKNLTVKNASVTGYLDVGVVAGTPYTSKYTNITVCGDVYVNGYAYVGGVFGKNAYANLTDITVDVNEGSYVKANSGNYRTYVGGVVGFMGEGNQIVSNVKSNIDVFGSTCDVGGITGIAHYGNQFINCVCTGNVTLENAPDEGDHLEIGGIAGVWHDQTGQKVTFTGCSFTGKLSTALNGVDKTADLNDGYYQITGRKYGSGTGTLLIDDVAVTNH